jgi:hypothetical protein
MRTVLYAHDMEPITILELNEFHVSILDKSPCLVIPITPEIKVTYEPFNPMEMCNSWTVTITQERFIRHNEVHRFLFTHDEENAMLLKSAFLPGQRWALKQVERDAFAEGFLRAFRMLR